MKHPCRLSLLPLVAAVLALGVPTSAPAQLVTRFEVSRTVFSPDLEDSTRVRYALGDSAVEVSVVIFEADSVTPVVTLRAPAPDGAGGNRDFGWKGLREDGSPAGEGGYVVTLRAVSYPDSLVTLRSLPVFVDVTPPQVQILSATPNLYAPGLEGASPAVEIAHLLSDTSPLATGRSIDRLTIAFRNPSGAPVPGGIVTTSPPYAGASGSYVSSWDATTLALESKLIEGEHEVAVTLDDAAGYSARSVYHFDVDLADPTIRVTTLAPNASVRVVPDTLRGDVFDRYGVDSLYVKYPSSQFQPVTSTRMQNDSLLFAIALADSVLAEGPFRLQFRAVDNAGRSEVHVFDFRYDLSSPAAPVLDAAGGTWRTVLFPLSGHAENDGDLSTIVLIHRNGAPVDSVATSVSESFTIDVPLVVGRNELVAYQRDGAGNVSAGSNTVVVTFKSSAGVFFPVPFVPGGTFQVSADRIARAATLRVFDVAGDLVTLFEDLTARQYYVFEWNGRNRDDQTVRRGPLVAVATIDYDDGTRDVMREVFLFDSNP